MRNIFVGIVLCALVVCAERVDAGLVFANPITGTNPNTFNPYTIGQTFDPNVTVSGIGRGSGINGANANNRFNANGWDTTALDTTAFFTFAITPNANHLISFTDVQFRIQRNDTSIANFAFRSNQDGFTGDIGTVTYVGTTGDASATLNSINLSGAQFQNVSDTIEFRLYAWGADLGSRTFSVNDFSFNGTVAAVPEPSSILLLGVAGAFGAVASKMRRRKRGLVGCVERSPMTHAPL